MLIGNSCLQILWDPLYRRSFFNHLLNSVRCPGMRFWYEILMWVDIALLLVLKQVPAATAAIMPNLICYCSVATVACIWYFDFLPPTLFGVSCLFVFFRQPYFIPCIGGDIQCIIRSVTLSQGGFITPIIWIFGRYDISIYIYITYIYISIVNGC